MRAAEAGASGGEKLAGLPTIRGGEGQRYYDGRGKRRSIYTTVPAAAVGVYHAPVSHPSGVGVLRPRLSAPRAIVHLYHSQSHHPLPL